MCVENVNDFVMMKQIGARKLGEHIDISSLNSKKGNHANKSSIQDHLLECNNNSSLREFGV